MTHALSSLSSKTSGHNSTHEPHPMHKSMSTTGTPMVSLLYQVLFNRRYHRHHNQLFPFVRLEPVRDHGVAKNAGLLFSLYPFVPYYKCPPALNVIHEKPQGGFVGFQLLPFIEAHECDPHFRLVREHLSGNPVRIKRDTLF